MLALAATLLFLSPALPPVAIPDATVAVRATITTTNTSNSATSTSTPASADNTQGPPAPTQPQPVAENKKPANPGLGNEVRPHPMEVAENYGLFSTIRISQPAALKPTEPISVEKLPSRRSWIILSAIQHSAAAFDAYSTRDAISHGAVEQDPLMRPFATSSGIYAAIQVIPVALDYTARKMQHNQNAFVRRMWWVPQTASTVGFLYSGAHNLQIAGRP
jgi:hypothetical protein